VEGALKKVLPEHRHNLIPLNKQALEKGAEFARKQTAAIAG
jgi:2-oxoglutarate ferredoxin oxidoreductase subunit gamma